MATGASAFASEAMFNSCEDKRNMSAPLSWLRVVAVHCVGLNMTTAVRSPFDNTIRSFALVWSALYRVYHFSTYRIGRETPIT